MKLSDPQAHRLPSRQLTTRETRLLAAHADTSEVTTIGFLLGRRVRAATREKIETALQELHLYDKSSPPQAPVSLANRRTASDRRAARRAIEEHFGFMPIRPAIVVLETMAPCMWRRCGKERARFAVVYGGTLSPQPSRRQLTQLHAGGICERHARAYMRRYEIDVGQQVAEENAPRLEREERIRCFNSEDHSWVGEDE